MADLGRDQEGQLDENERLDRRLGALGQDVKAQRHAAAELRTHLDDLTALVRELAERQAAETRGERAIWWPDLPAGKERTAALRLLGPGLTTCSAVITPSLSTTVSKRAGIAMMTCSTN